MCQFPEEVGGLGVLHRIAWEAGRTPCCDSIKYAHRTWRDQARARASPLLWPQPTLHLHAQLARAHTRVNTRKAEVVIAAAAVGDWECESREVSRCLVGVKFRVWAASGSLRCC